MLFKISLQDLTEQLQKEREKLDDSGPAAKRKMLNDSSSMDFDEFTQVTQKKVSSMIEHTREKCKPACPNIIGCLCKD